MKAADLSSIAHMQGAICLLFTYRDDGPQLPSQFYIELVSYATMTKYR